MILEIAIYIDDIIECKRSRRCSRLAIDFARRDCIYFSFQKELFLYTYFLDGGLLKS